MKKKNPAMGDWCSVWRGTFPERNHQFFIAPVLLHTVHFVPFYLISFCIVVPKRSWKAKIIVTLFSPDAFYRIIKSTQRSALRFSRSLDTSVWGICVVFTGWDLNAANWADFRRLAYKSHYIICWIWSLTCAVKLRLSLISCCES